jgi:hypothetical protein
MKGEPMKTLILTDETYGQLVALPGVTALLHHEPERLEPDRELVHMARNGVVPQAFTRAVAFRDAAREAADDTREVVEDLIRHAHAAGVGPTRLAEWAQIRPRRIYELMEKSA